MNPLLVIHGIGNHDANAIKATVTELQSKLPERHLILVQWGDLGGLAAGIEDTVPVFGGAERTSDTRGPVEYDALESLFFGQMASNSVRATASATDNQVAMGIAKAAQAVLMPSKNTVRQSPSNGISEAVKAALPQTKYLRYLLTAEAQQAVGTLLGHGLQQTDSTNSSRRTRGSSTSLLQRVGQLIGDMDRFAGIMVSETAGGALSWIRTTTRKALAESVGDILAYLSHRDQVHERLFQRVEAEAPGWGVDDRPIDVIAHSLGGLIALDVAVRSKPLAPRQLHIGKLVTFGSQPAFFHVLAPRDGLKQYRPPDPTALPNTVGAWTNLWHPLDPLSFLAGTVFQLHNGTKPRDVRVDSSMTQVVKNKAWMHSIYWENPGLIRAIQGH